MNVIKALDHSNVSALIMLDLAAAFDTVHPQTVKDVMQRRFGVRGNALNWLVDFLMSRCSLSELTARNMIELAEMIFSVAAPRAWN
jgi:hypothetical protein